MTVQHYNSNAIIFTDEALNGSINISFDGWSDFVEEENAEEKAPAAPAASGRRVQPAAQQTTGRRVQATETPAPAAAPAPVVEEVVTVDETDDLELIAVITAAIAAQEGTSTDGFVVRSIRRRPSNKWN